MSKIKYVVGNLFEHIPQEKVIIAHVVNNLGVAGAGFVIPLSNRFCDWKENYQEWIENLNSFSSFDESDSIIGEVGFGYKEGNITIADMIGQEGVGFKDGVPIRYDGLFQAMKTVSDVAQLTKARIICPKFGAGLAGGRWPIIEAMIKELWIKKDIDVTVYVLDESEIPPAN